jgi:hypothetical protein
MVPRGIGTALGEHGHGIAGGPPGELSDNHIPKMLEIPKETKPTDETYEAFFLWDENRS